MGICFQMLERHWIWRQLLFLGDWFRPNTLGDVGQIWLRLFELAKKTTSHRYIYRYMILDVVVLVLEKICVHAFCQTENGLIYITFRFWMCWNKRFSPTIPKVSIPNTVNPTVADSRKSCSSWQIAFADCGWKLVKMDIQNAQDFFHPCVFKWHMHETLLFRKKTIECLSTYQRFSMFVGFQFSGWKNIINTLPETNSSPLKIGLLPQKERLVFRPSIFRCELLVSGSVSLRSDCFDKLQEEMVIFVDPSLWTDWTDKKMRWEKWQIQAVENSYFLQYHYMQNRFDHLDGKKWSYTCHVIL